MQTDGVPLSSSGKAASISPLHNNQRDGMHRQAIHRGRVSYEPNSLGGGCPFQAGMAGFVSFPESVRQDKVRGKPEKFAEHFNQAMPFFESQTPVEQAHIIAAFRFELSKVTVPAIRERAVSMLVTVSPKFAASVAEGLGIAVPATMPRALAKPPKAGVKAPRAGVRGGRHAVASDGLFPPSNKKAPRKRGLFPGPSTAVRPPARSAAGCSTAPAVRPRGPWPCAGARP